MMTLARRARILRATALGSLRIYGEENHPSGCATWWTHCNIMQSNVDNSARKFYFESSTGAEIQCRFYNNLEYGVNC